MFRYLSLMVTAIVLTAAVCTAEDDAKTPPPTRAGSTSKHPTQRAVTAALVWLANHQAPDGSWSLQNYTQRCIDKTCTGAGTVPADPGATAMGLLPFLAAGQTHKTKGPYMEHVRRGIDWLIRHQQPDGNLAKGTQQMMYSHGLATMALSEAYDLTGDKHVGQPAQSAVNFILAAQNAADGGWRYNPGDPGDTSVFGWQLMALKSAKFAGLNVGESVFTGASKWLDSVAVREGTEYAYQPGNSSAPTMTAVGLLGRQYLGAKRDNPMLTGGMKYLMNHLPDESFPDVYYWYYGTQVMHNMSGNEWDTWNRKMRDLLLRTQVCDMKQCAYGSWDPAKDAWGRHGGRVMQTSLSALILEVYNKPWNIRVEATGGNTDNAKPEPGREAEKSQKSVIMTADGDGSFSRPRPTTLVLNWLANHQFADGHWSLHAYTHRCKDETCTGQSDITNDAAATALGLLPFLGTGQTHRSKGPYQEHILKGIDWLIAHQQPDGNLAKGSAQTMYGHGLATIVLCEDYGLTGDRRVGLAAQAAVNFILVAQNPQDGGWRYNPGDPGDTSVLGWQLTALKSAHMAGLNVGGDVFRNAGKYLDSVAIRGGMEYGYQPGTAPSHAMTAVGLLGRQFLGAKRDDPLLAGGLKYLLNHLPDEKAPNVYCWYHVTQVAHNMGGDDWITWNRKVRDILVRTQVRDAKSCANGSWDPAGDVWGKQGGRLMTTSLSTLTLEVYYRYLPIFKAGVMPSEEGENKTFSSGGE